MTDTPSDVVADKPQIADMPSAVAQVYKDATDNLIYLKREQVQITYYTWLLLAAVYILSRNHQSVCAQTGLSIGSILVGFFSIAFILSFYRSMRKFRGRLNQIYNSTYFTAEQRTALHLHAGKHRFVTTLLAFICAVASLFIFLIIASRIIVRPHPFLEGKACLLRLVPWQ